MDGITGARRTDRLVVGPVAIPYVTRRDALERVARALRGTDGPLRVAFCNANTMLRALSSPHYARALGGFLVLNDGVGVNLCSRLFTGGPFPDNLNGTDFTPEVLRSAPAPLRVFLLGGAPGTAEAAEARLRDAHPRHSFVGALHGFFGEDGTEDVLAAIESAAPDLLLVGMGNPRQEEFIARTAGRLTVPVVMAVGAFLDFAAGNVVRAPMLVRAFRAEWLFRLVQEPRRLGRRYTFDVAAFLLAIALWRLRAGRTLQQA